MENVETAILIEILEMLRDTEKLRTEDTTSLLALVRSFRALGPDYEDLYNKHRSHVESLRATRLTPDVPAVIQTLIDRLKARLPTE